MPITIKNGNHATQTYRDSRQKVCDPEERWVTNVRHANMLKNSAGGNKHDKKDSFGYVLSSNRHPMLNKLPIQDDDRRQVSQRPPADESWDAKPMETNWSGNQRYQKVDAIGLG